MELTIKLVLFFAGIALWILGGQIRGRIRDIGFPIVISTSIWFVTRSWLLGLLVAATAQSIRLGYGNWDPEHDDKPSFLARLIHDRKGNVIRMAYGFICSALIGLPLVLAGQWIMYIIYVVLNTGIGSLSTKLQVYAMDTLVSAGLGSIIFLVK
jgi:hypothetical protein